MLLAARASLDAGQDHTAYDTHTRPVSRTMASAQPPAAAERVALSQPQRSQCGSTAGAHARLLSFARAQSAPPHPAFGAPSALGAAAPPAFPSPPPEGGFERALAAAQSLPRAFANKSTGSLVGSPPPDRVRAPVPKRMREPMSVDALAGLFDGLRCPAQSGVSLSEESALAERLAALDVQKRRRRCDAADMPALAGGAHTASASSTADHSARDVVNPHAQKVQAPDDADGHADELSFLVEQCGIEDEDKDNKFMPYIV